MMAPPPFLPKIAFRHSRLLLGALLCIATLGGCAMRSAAPACSGPACPPENAVQDPFIDELYGNRDWALRRTLAREKLDPVRLAAEADLPIEQAEGRIFDTRAAAARDAFAAKLWMIENARHTLDLAYYIYTPDLAGQAMLAALCDAVIRGVDERLLVDSASSLKTSSLSLAWLGSCADNAGWMVNEDGAVTNRRARIQIAIFNALSRLTTSPNRRSHDKLLLADGRFAERALMVTGGRNVSLAYYGFTDDGREDLKAYQDMELLLRPRATEGAYSIGDISSGYFTMLFTYRGNRRISGSVPDEQYRRAYDARRAQAYAALDRIRSMPLMAPHFRAA